MKGYATVAFIDTDGWPMSVTVGLDEIDTYDPWGRREVAKAAAIAQSEALRLHWVDHVKWSVGDVTPRMQVTAPQGHPQGGPRLARLDGGDPVRFFFDTERERTWEDAKQRKLYGLPD
jgi:hypothetical protein